MEKSESPVLKAIYERRSIRHFSDAGVDREKIKETLKAASWAPSGLNNQPWRFALIQDADVKERLAKLTRYANTMRGAAVLVAVFLDTESSYDRTKDCQAVGAAIQNLMLAAQSMDLGTAWIGEILKNKDEVRKILDLPERLELMAVVAVGEPAHRDQSSHRRPLEELIVFDR